MQNRLRKAAGQRPASCVAWIAALVLVISTLAFALPAAFAQHVANPYSGATVYVSPDWTNEVGTAVATEPAGSALANQMTIVGKTPTFVWMDHIGAIYGGAAGNGRMSLAQHIAAAASQANGAPIVVQLVIYDLPDRDCAALASNGELSISGGDTVIGPTGAKETLVGTGLQEYETDYITPIVQALAAAPSNVRFVLVVEDDSLPNIVTNSGYSFSIANCVAANDGMSYPTYSLSGVYVQAIQYALNQFHALPNVYNYLDIGHHGWLGWPQGAALAFPFYANVVKGTTAGFASVDGIITNTANYGPTKEPYMTATEQIGGSPVDSATFYSFNPEIDEVDYAQEFYTGLTGAGFPSTLGFLIDTSRNGWGGSTRPTGPSTSTVVNTFVDATKIDGRDDMGQWCKQQNQGIGSFPTVNPGGSTNLQAYVWVKPPGESDGDYPNGDTNAAHLALGASHGDENCDPAHDNTLANGLAVSSIPNSPPAGTFWLTEFLQDVQNAFPPIATTTTPGFSISASGVTIEQGTTTTSGVTITAVNGFNSAVALTISGLPSGVTASFSPASVTGSAGSTLTLTASNTATVGAATVTITGTSGSTIETTTLSLTVTAEPNFTISISPTALSVPPNTNPTATITVTFVGGLTGSVSLSATGLPSGVSANFAPSSLNSSGTATVNFFSQTSTPAGTTNISIVGTDGSVTHSATLALTTGSGTAGFTLAASPTSVALTQGSTATDTISVTDTGGFTGAVTLSASSLPSGVTAAFGTNPTTGSSVMTLSATSSATPGAYTVTINGVSGSTTASTTIALSVASQSQGSFTLKASVSPLSVAQGASGTDTITVTDVSPFSGSVSFAASGMPSGVTASFSPTSSATSSVLTLSVGSSVAAGNYPITITGTSGSLTASTSVTLTVTSSSTGSFTLKASASPLSVAQGASGTDTITVTDVSPFSGSVTFAASGMPTGVTASFSPASSTSSSVVTFAVASTTVAGSYPITITGTSGSLTASASITLTVTSTTGNYCHIVYTIGNQWPGGFGAAITLENTGTANWTSWTLTWTYANGQTITQLWNGTETQSGANVTVSNLSYNGSIPAGGSYTGMGFNGSWTSTNSVPSAFAVNGHACN